MKRIKGEAPWALRACYDLEVCPATFDVVSFILLAKREQRRLSCETLSFLIIPGCHGGFRKGHREHYNLSNWRMRHVLMDSLSAFAPEANLLVFQSRGEAAAYLNDAGGTSVYPESYNVEAPVAGYSTALHIRALRMGRSASVLSVTSDARYFARQWIDSHCGGMKPVSITLRQCPYEEARNSDVNSWIRFAKELGGGLFVPVFVLDTDAALSSSPELEGLLVFSEASFNVELRAAFYEECYLNLMVNNGTSLLCYNNPKARYLYFKVMTEGVSSACLSYFLGFEFWPGSNWPSSSGYQKFIWEDDRESVIQLAFEEMVLRIEGESGTRPKELLSRISSALSGGLVQDALDLSAVGTAFYQDDLDLWEARRDVLMAAGRVREAFYLLKQPIFEGRLEDSGSQKWVLALCQSSLYWKDGYMLGDCIRRILSLDADAQSEFRRSVLSSLGRRSGENGRDIKGGQDIAIFGASEGGRRCLVSDRRRERVVAWIDNDESKWGGSFEGLPVVSLEEVEALSIGRIIVASRYCFDILVQLLEEGWPLDRLELAPLEVLQRPLGEKTIGGDYLND